MASTAASVSIDEQALLETFLTMVKINSPSGDEGALRDYLIARVADWRTVCPDITHRVDAGGNLVVDLPAHDCDHDAVLVLSGHLDVVPPCLDIRPVVETTGDGETVIHSDNTTVLGADDKAGLAPIVEAVGYVLRQQAPRPRTRLILTTREEVNLQGAKELDDASLAASFAVIFDHTGRQGVIIHRAPTYLRFEITFSGKSVHAGIMPEQGVNAIVFASKVLSRLPMGRIDAETTGNVGFFNGGKGTNVVPDHVAVEGELRGHNRERLAALQARFVEILEAEKAAMPGTDYALTWHTEFEGYALAADHPGLRRVERSMRALAIAPELIVTNGGSDNNVFMVRGLPGVVLSAGYVAPHSLKERVKLSEMTTCTRLIMQLLADFAAEAF